MARSRSGNPGSPGLFVTALTVTALAVIGFFGYRASAADDRPVSAPPPSDSEGAFDEEGVDGEAGPESEDGEADAGEPALPEDSGQGQRVVYSLGERQVWLVDTADDGLGEEILLSYEVHPSSVDPDPGSYEVTSRTAQLTGSDGVPIQHSVIFDAPPADVVFGFSSAVDGSVPDPDGAERTGGIRQAEDDGAALWEFTPVGTAIVVVP